MKLWPRPATALCVLTSVMPSCSWLPETVPLQVPDRALSCLCARRIWEWMGWVRKKLSETHQMRRNVFFCLHLVWWLHFWAEQWGRARRDGACDWDAAAGAEESANQCMLYSFIQEHSAETNLFTAVDAVANVLVQRFNRHVGYFLQFAYWPLYCNSLHAELTL